MEEEEGWVGVDYEFDHEMSDVWVDYEKLMDGNLDLMEEIMAVEVVDFEEDVSDLQDAELVGDDEDDVVDVVDWMLANIDFEAADDDLFRSWLEDDDIC